MLLSILSFLFIIYNNSFNMSPIIGHLGCLHYFNINNVVMQTSGCAENSWSQKEDLVLMIYIYNI